MAAAAPASTSNARAPSARRAVGQGAAQPQKEQEESRTRNWAPGARRSQPRVSAASIF